MSGTGTALELRRVSKRYPGTLAVSDIDLEIRSGEVHAIVGENGAGKSTLMKIIAGCFDDYTGEVSVNGKPVTLHSPAAAKTLGIEMIQQELSLAGPLSIAENVLAGRLPTRRGLLDTRATCSEARRCLAPVGLDDLDPSTPVEDLPRHQAQLVEIAKALGNIPCILVMDEPTSALSREEVARLFDIIRRLVRQGLAIVYISHHLSEVFEVADRITVLRDGRKVGTFEAREVSSREVVEAMIGGAASDLYAERASSPGDVKLSVRGLTRYGFFHDCSLDVRAGEIVGIGGLSGAGRSELARSLCGIDPVDEGHVELDGRRIAPASYAEAIRDGLAYLTEDRKTQGLALRLSVAENVLSAIIPWLCRAGICTGARDVAIVTRWLSALRIQPPEPDREMATFSGGNQQKALLAKWLATDPQVLILDEPTRGVDIGAKAIIHRAIAELADRGKCVILISSDLPELVGLSDRVLVMRRGHFIAEMTGPECTEEAVLLAANGEGPAGPPTEEPHGGDRPEAGGPISGPHPNPLPEGEGEQIPLPERQGAGAHTSPYGQGDRAPYRAQPFLRSLLGVGSVYAVVVLLVVLGCIVRPDFLSPENVLQTLKDVSILGIVAVGLCFVTLGGHYVDLSIPAIMACSGIVAVYVLPSGFPSAVLAGLGMGAALGLANGLMVGYLRLNPILWTLAAMSLVDGITRWAYGGKWIYALHDTPSGALFGSLYAGEVLGVIPTTVVIFVGVAVAGDALLRGTGFGRRLKLTGAAYEAARLSGVDTRRTIMWAFVFSGLASALAGIVKTSFNMYGDVDIGLTYDFQAVTAVVIGGVTLAGGRGSMPGVIGGVLVIGLLGRILPLIHGIGQDQQFIIRGIIFISVVGISMYMLRRSGRSDV